MAPMTIDNTTGNLYVLDGTLVKIVTPSAIVTTYATLPSTGTNIAMDSSKNIYIANMPTGSIGKISP
jgi:hypothetical protein